MDVVDALESKSADRPDAMARDRGRLLLDQLIHYRWLEEPLRRDWRLTLAGAIG